MIGNCDGQGSPLWGGDIRAEANKIAGKAVVLWGKNIPAKETNRAGSKMGGITQSVNSGLVPVASCFLLIWNKISQNSSVSFYSNLM